MEQTLVYLEWERKKRGTYGIPMLDKNLPYNCNRLRIVYWVHLTFKTFHYFSFGNPCLPGHRFYTYLLRMMLMMTSAIFYKIYEDRALMLCTSRLEHQFEDRNPIRDPVDIWDGAFCRMFSIPGSFIKYLQHSPVTVTTLTPSHFQRAFNRLS